MIRQPAIFVGHGNPMLALAAPDSEYAKVWRAMAAELPKPKAIVALSAHWYTAESAVTAQEHPPTIHDFGRFPQELFDVEYPAPGDPKLAAKIAQLVSEVKGSHDTKLSNDWGLDHGTWAVLRHMYPNNDIPVVQLSLDSRQPMEYHYEIGQRLAALRDEGVMIFGTGNIVHNFSLFKPGSKDVVPWAQKFLDWFVDVTLDGKVDRNNAKEHPIVNWQSLGVETDIDHLLPSVYVLGTAANGEKITWNSKAWDLGSFSMACFTVG